MQDREAEGPEGPDAVTSTTATVRFIVAVVPVLRRHLVELATKAALAGTAKTLAQSYELVQHSSITYIPTNWRTLDKGPCDPEDCIWLPLTRPDKRRMANSLGNILFANDSEITNFDLMLRQFSREVDNSVSRLLIKTEDGLRVLNHEGQLETPDGSFLPNYIAPQLNTDETAKAEVRSVITEWLRSEEEATSLLYHLATALSPGWSAVKYLLLIGDGRNGKSVLLQMLADLFGTANVSNVTRQQMADFLPVCSEMNNKLLNIVYDGKMTYIKDSSMEKTVIAGEPGYVRMLYENGSTKVQTNALFLEALNSEPKTRDKSSALQKRLSRFWFPNVYELDYAFEKRMRSPHFLGAFLSLLLDHFVPQEHLAEKLKPTDGARQLQVEQQLLNSPALQYVQHLIDQDPNWVHKFETGGHALEPLINSFMAWRLLEGYNEYSSADVKRMFKELFHVERKSFREAGKVVKREQLGVPKGETQALLDQAKGDHDGVQPGPLVED